MRCPTCSSLQRFHHPSQGLERRRFPNGRWVCEHELQPWHLQLETARRELAICNSEAIKNALLFLVAQLESQALIHQETTPPRPSLPDDRDGVKQRARSPSSGTASGSRRSTTGGAHHGNNEIVPTQAVHLSRSA
jgi:hypothetical protein